MSVSINDFEYALSDQQFTYGRQDLARDYGTRFKVYSGLIIGLRLANERRCYFVTTSLIGWMQA